MAAERERRRTRIRALVDDLPDEERKLLDDMLADVRYTYQDISDALEERGFALSKSSVGRYALRSSEAANRLREVRERTEQLIKTIKEGQDIQAGEVATSMMMDMLVQRLATAEEEIDTIPLDKVGNMLAQLQRSTIYKSRYKDTRKRTIEALEANIMARIRDLVQGDDELTERLLGLVNEAAKEEAAKEDG